MSEKEISKSGYDLRRELEKKIELAANFKISQKAVRDIAGALPRQIVVMGRRWFNKTWGNTYFSVAVYVNGEFIAKVPYEYGYGDQYMQRAVQLLIDAGFYPAPKDGGYKPLWQFAQDTGDKLLYFVADVATKKEL